jgi:hypothetical protein
MAYLEADSELAGTVNTGAFLVGDIECFVPILRIIVPAVIFHSKAQAGSGGLCNPSTQETDGVYQFKTSLDYTADPLKKNQKQKKQANMFYFVRIFLAAHPSCHCPLSQGRSLSAFLSSTLHNWNSVIRIWISLSLPAACSISL